MKKIPSETVITFYMDETYTVYRATYETKNKGEYSEIIADLDHDDAQKILRSISQETLHNLLEQDKHIVKLNQEKDA